MERPSLDARGQAVKFFRVYAVTSGGTNFTVDLKDEQTSQVEAQKVLKARAIELDKLLKL